MIEKWNMEISEHRKSAAGGASAPASRSVAMRKHFEAWTLVLHWGLELGFWSFPKRRRKTVDRSGNSDFSVTRHPAPHAYLRRCPRIGRAQALRNCSFNADFVCPPSPKNLTFARSLLYPCCLNLNWNFEII